MDSGQYTRISTRLEANFRAFRSTDTRAPALSPNSELSKVLILPFFCAVVKGQTMRRRYQAGCIDSGITLVNAWFLSMPIKNSHAIKSFAIDIGCIFLHYSTHTITSHAI
ncbi:hypothetical protein [Paraburkholderia sp. BL23I1N1]|uniref:hypothetical protein n=1 Tax=Paraburkholderia sp. BL23I1N1 TaxID=1938802 RepID=UPI0011C3B0D8|nr:hypothetical protein [Paraburkholderia sp. BL23I1N1]